MLLFVVLAVVVMACNLTNAQIADTPTSVPEQVLARSERQVPTLESYTTRLSYNVRSGPGVEYPVITTLTDAEVTIQQSVGSWYMIEYKLDGNVYYGYIHADSKPEEK